MTFFTVKRIGADLNGNSKYLIQGFKTIEKIHHLYMMTQSDMQNICGRWSDKKDGNISKLNKQEITESILHEYKDAFYAYS